MDAPVRFTFADDNPFSSTTYARSRYRDLPEYVLEVIDRRLGVCGLEWDLLVEDGEVFEHFRRSESFPVNPAKVRPSSRVRQPCSTCQGRGAVCQGVRAWETCPACKGRKWHPVYSEDELRALGWDEYGTASGPAVAA